MHVDGDRAVEDGEPVDDELLADLGRLGLDQVGDGLAVERRGEQRLDVGRPGRGDVVDQLLGQRDEVRRSWRRSRSRS